MDDDDGEIFHFGGVFMRNGLTKKIRRKDRGIVNLYCNNGNVTKY